MKPRENLMVDLETMGMGSCAAIVAIGAVFFDPTTGAAFRIKAAELAIDP